LSGAGGLRFGARWHHKGQPIVYLSESAASALLEVCVHTASNDVPPELLLLRVEGPDVPVAPVEDLPNDWRDRQDVTRALGTAWLREGREVLLRVPSAIVPATSNFLYNPLHADAQQFRVADAFPFPFDARLKA
jgi:RES domain-containing protein